MQYYGEHHLPESRILHAPMQPKTMPFAPMIRPSYPPTYGTGVPEPKTLYEDHMPRRETSNKPIVSLVLPWFLFVAIYSAMAFSLHYSYPRLCFLVVSLGFFVVVVLAARASKASKKHARFHESRSPPRWETFLAITCGIAWLLAVLGGSKNFEVNMHPFYDIVSLNTYQSVDASQALGNMMMDAGRIRFIPGTKIDEQLSMKFTDLETYCVAPIVSPNMSGATSYDFWAVGTNCCPGLAKGSFHCAEFDNPAAMSGLRLMRDNQREQFRLAVQQAEAAYDIHAHHPLFFYWMRDPTAELKAYQNDGYNWFIFAIFLHFCFQLALTVGASAVIGGKA